MAKPQVNERWQNGSQMRTVVRVVDNDWRKLSYRVFVRITYHTGVVRGEWMTGHEWSRWLNTRHAKKVQDETP